MRRQGFATSDASSAVLPEAVADPAAAEKGGHFTPQPHRTALITAALVYLAVSVAMFAQVWRHPFSSVMGGADGNLFVWWVKWVPHALMHGENPLFTDYLNSPFGVNGMWNTSVAILALLVAPITLILGPIFSVNVLFTLGLAVSGFTFFYVIRRYTTKQWPAFIGGLAFIVAPFEIAHARGHLNLIWNFLPPLIVLFLDEIFIRQRIRAWKIGVLFGLTLAIQTLISTELLAIGVIMFCVGAFLLIGRMIGQAIARRRNNRPSGQEFQQRGRYVFATGVAAALSYLVICGYPLYVLFAKPGRPHGTVRGFGVYSSDLVNLLTPTKTELFGFTSTNVANRFGLGIHEQTLYIGPVVLVVAVVATFALKRQRILVTTLTLGGIIALLFTLGPRIIVLHQTTNIPLPWAIIGHFPLLDQMVGSRFSLYVGFCAFALLTLWLDSAAQSTRKFLRFSQLGIGGLALITILPTAPFETTTIPVPPFFAKNTIAHYVHQGETIKTFPIASTDHQIGGFAMVWQAMSNMQYRMTSGYFIGSAPGHPVLLQGISDAYDKGAQAISAGRQETDRRVPSIADVRTSLTSAHIAAIVIVALPDNNSGVVVNWTRKVTNLSGQYIDGVWIFDLIP